MDKKYVVVDFNIVQNPLFIVMKYYAEVLIYFGTNDKDFREKLIKDDHDTVVAVFRIKYKTWGDRINEINLIKPKE